MPESVSRCQDRTFSYKPRAAQVRPTSLVAASFIGQLRTELLQISEQETRDVGLVLQQSGLM
jgi:hypothetical protein